MFVYVLVKVAPGKENHVLNKILENEKVYGGGGDEKHLLLIPPSEIIGGATVARIRK